MKNDLTSELPEWKQQIADIYKNRKVYSIDEVCQILSDIDPCSPHEPTEEQQILFERFKASMQDATEFGILKDKQLNPDAFLSPAQYTSYSITRWCESIGLEWITPSFNPADQDLLIGTRVEDALRNQLVERNQIIDQLDEEVCHLKKEVSRLFSSDLDSFFALQERKCEEPCGISFPYITPELKAMRDAIERFRLNDSTDSNTTLQKEISSYICTLLGLTPDAAGSTRLTRSLAAAIKPVKHRD